MPNTYFQFKQFKVNQDQCGMKVTTDGCFFGAVIEPVAEGRILDIGTGTGLLSLMLAQRSTTHIEAIEIDDGAYHQAQANFSTSPWKDRLRVHHSPLQEFSTQVYYDQLVCNPPFFANSQQGKSNSKNLALHASTLSMDELLQYGRDLLKTTGSFWIMYPEEEMNQLLEKSSAHGFFLSKEILVRNTEEGAIFRKIVKLTKAKPEQTERESYFIRSALGDYSEAFNDYLKPYYLHL